MTPSQLGYRWPAEWEPHASTWLAWPRNPETWPGKFELIPARYAAMVRIISRFERVNLLCDVEEMVRHSESLLIGATNVVLHDIPTNDSWSRDHGPTFLGGEGLPPALVDWRYNAWGGKYPPFDLDNAVPAAIAAVTRREPFVADIILEGGAIEGNGAGTVLTTTSCLLNPNRNPTKSRADMEQYLVDYLGARKVLWLEDAHLAGDDTDGHIDQLARFVNANTVLVASEANKNDENYAPLTSIRQQLENMTTADDEPLQIISLPLPRPAHYNGQRLPASYANYYVANGLVLVPQFQDPADKAACRILQEQFPDREVIGLDSLDLVWGLGSFHCLTQQEPA